MKEKRIWRFFLTILVAISMMIVMLPLSGLKTQAAEIGAMSATSDDLYTPSYGDVVTLPTVVTTSANDAIVTVRGWSRDGKDVTPGSNFEAGEYSLYLAATIDRSSSSDTFEQYPTLTVNGEYWNFANLWEVDGNPVAYFYKIYNVDPAPVITFDDLHYYVDESKVSVAITPLDITPGVIGGTAPYTFVKESGPAWLNVSSEGVVSGTPPTYGKNDNLVIKITDKNGEKGTAELTVQATKPDDRMPIIDVIGRTTPRDLHEMVKRGGTIETADFTVTDDYSTKIDGEEYWQKYDEVAETWIKVDSGTFTDGTYRYWVSVKANDPVTYSYVEPYLFMEVTEEDEEMWNLASYDAGNSTASFYSNDYVVNEEIKEITVSGVPSPIVGIGSSIYGTTVKEDGIFIDNAYWIDDDGNILSEGDPFESTKQYAITLVLVTGEGYDFAKEEDLKIKVNGLDSGLTLLTREDHMIAFQCPIPFATAINDKYVVIAGALNVRSGPTPNADRIGGLKYADLFQAEAESGGWVMFPYTDQTGWVNREYVAITINNEAAYEDPVRELQKYTVTAGSLTVRSSPYVQDDPISNRIGAYSGGTEILTTAKVKNAGEEWLVVDYGKDGNHQLGFVMAKYTVKSEGASTEINIPSFELHIFTGGAPEEFSAVPKSAIAIDDNVTLQNEHFTDNGDGTFLVNIFPSDGKNFTLLTAADVELPELSYLKVLGLTRLDDGSIDLKLGPAGVYTVKFETNGGSEIASQTVLAGNQADQPETPVKEGYTFDRWFSDAAFTSQFNFSTPITDNMTLYGRWMTNVTGVKLHGNGTKENSDGQYVLVTDALEVLFEKDPAEIGINVMPFFKDASYSGYLTTAPEKGTTYYFGVEVEDKYGSEGRPDVFFGNAMKTGNEASAEEADVEFVELFRSPGGKYATVIFSYTEKEITYTFSKGADASWTKGSADGLDLVVNRSLNDDKTFSLFDRIEVNGVVLDAADYTAAFGSLEATLKASYLETLSAGTHSIKIFFEDGSAETSLTLKEAEKKDDPAPSEDGGKNTDDGKSPKTGDPNQTRVYLILIIASLAALLGLSIYFRKRLQ